MAGPSNCSQVQGLSEERRGISQGGWNRNTEFQKLTPRKWDWVCTCGQGYKVGPLLSSRESCISEGVTQVCPCCYLWLHLGLLSSRTSIWQIDLSPWNCLLGGKPWRDRRWEICTQVEGWQVVGAPGRDVGKWGHQNSGSGYRNGTDICGAPKKYQTWPSMEGGDNYWVIWAAVFPPLISS